MISLAFLALFTAPGSAQAQSVPTFEVASVKESLSQEGPPTGGFSPISLTQLNTTLRTLIRTAYGLQQAQIAGGPEWMDSKHFDVSARMAATTPEGAVSMLKALLTERFGLTTHTETRMLPAYSMAVAARGLRKNLKKADPQDCPKTAPGTKSAPCFGVKNGYNGPVKTMDGSNLDMGMVAWAFSNKFGRMVKDDTGIQGVFNFHLEWEPEPGDEDQSATIVLAAEDQLGLKLTVQKSPVQVLVIDQAHLPTEN